MFRPPRGLLGKSVSSRRSCHQPWRADDTRGPRGARGQGRKPECGVAPQSRPRSCPGARDLGSSTATGKLGGFWPLGGSASLSRGQPFVELLLCAGCRGVRALRPGRPLPPRGAASCKPLNLSVPRFPCLEPGINRPCLSGQIRGLNGSVTSPEPPCTLEPLVATLLPLSRASCHLILGPCGPMQAGRARRGSGPGRARGATVVSRAGRVPALRGPPA